MCEPAVALQDDYPRSMRDAAVRERRRFQLSQSHMAPLVEFVGRLRKKPGVEVPDFDPLDGGIEAQALFLLEKPGPMTASLGGSGFISRNNDDPSAEATYQFMNEARIPRKTTITWNVVPWWNGTRKVTIEELREGVASAAELIRLLPKLSVIVLVGRKAQRAGPPLQNFGLPLLSSYHPSPLVRAKFHDHWLQIPEQWARVREFFKLKR